jgi:hypothetical protein
MSHPNKEKYMRLQGLIIKEFLQIRREYLHLRHQQLPEWGQIHGCIIAD